MMFIYLVSLFELFSFSSGTEPCLAGSTNQYQCWGTNGILSQEIPVCINSADRCDAADSCECPWCDDQWNCPSFEGCQENGGFLCSNSYLPGTNQLWACIPAEWKCDGIWDCPSGEDEGSEYCNVGKCAGNHNLTYWYQCSDTGRCISINSVGNGEIDCVDGEDENPTIIEEIRTERTTETIPIAGTTADPEKTIVSTGEPKNSGTPSPTTSFIGSHTPTNKPTSSPTLSNNYPYGIDLVIQVSGVYLAEVCSGFQARFQDLETAVAFVLNLKQFQVSSTCQRNNNHNRLLHSLLDIESDDDEDSGEEDIFSRHDHTVIVKLNFSDKQDYLRLLKEILTTGHSRKEAHKSVAKLSDEIQSELSNILGKLVEIKITRVSGTF